MSKTLFTSTKEFSKNVAYFILGFVLLSGFIIPIILSLPIFLYRWIICQVLGPLCRKDSGKAVDLAGSCMAIELKRGRVRDHNQPRFVLIYTTNFEGDVQFEELRDRIQRYWITPECSTSKGLKYPEFQQFVTSWMGYLFWEQDKSFNLDNHLKHHKCEDNWTEMECEKYTCSVAQHLLNKPFPDGRSPWEIHMISNFKDSKLTSDGKDTIMTVLVCRFHHCISDGHGLFTAFGDAIFDIPFSKCTLAPSPNSKSRKVGLVTDCLRKLSYFGSFPIKFIRDVGYFGSLTLCPLKTPWYIPVEKRTGRQLYTRSGNVPLQKLKFVKDTFGVSLTATLLSSIGAGMSSYLKSRDIPNHIKELPFGSPLPLKDHPLILRNHWSGTFYGIPIDQTLNPLERLMESEKLFQTGKESTYSELFQFTVKLVGSHLPFISRTLLSNRTLSAGLTSFPGPTRQISGFGRNIVGMDFGAGLAYGVAGLGFMALSYGNHIRISIVVENAAMERYEMEELLKTVCDEIDNLYEMAESHNQKQ